MTARKPSAPDDGMAAMRNAARLELGRIYAKPRPEFEQPKRAHLARGEAMTPALLDLEIEHFASFRLTDAEIAEKLSISKTRVARWRAAHAA